MYATSLFLIYGSALVIQVFAQPTTEVERIASKPEETTRNAAKQSQSASKKTSSKVANAATSFVPEVFESPSSPNEALQSLTDIHIESATDVDTLIKDIERAADDIYNSEMANIQSWSQDEILAPFQSQAEKGLTIARDRLKESAQKLRTKATEAIENAQATMTPEEFSRYMKELQQVIEIELAPTRQYFMDAAEAITQVAKETAARTTTTPPAPAPPSRGSKSRKKNNNNNNVQNVPSQAANVPLVASAA